jgi:hypothetical protein
MAEGRPMTDEERWIIGMAFSIGLVLGAIWGALGFWLFA